jgi:hypothetical protein
MPQHSEIFGKAGRKMFPGHGNSDPGIINRTESVSRCCSESTEFHQQLGGKNRSLDEIE